MRKRITAIVCVYNRQDTLPQCLEALTQQSIPSSLFEIVVVDNNSTDNSLKIATEFAKNFDHCRVVQETKQGLAAARNRGMCEADSPIAAFTDDDAIPANDWAARLLQRFDELGEKVAAIGGELDPIWGIPKPTWLKGDKLLHSLSVCLNWSEFARYLSKAEWLCEANSAYRIALLQERGGFPENLGRIGENLLSGENAINEILLRDGFRFFFDPEIRVQHQIPKERLEKKWFRRRFFWQGVTTYLVKQYLAEKKCEIEASSVVAVPMNEASWNSVFSDADDENFDRALDHTYGLGYLLAANKLLGGR